MCDSYSLGRPPASLAVLVSQLLLSLCQIGLKLVHPCLGVFKLILKSVQVMLPKVNEMSDYASHSDAVSDDQTYWA